MTPRRITFVIAVIAGIIMRAAGVLDCQPLWECFIFGAGIGAIVTLIIELCGGNLQ